MDHFTNHKRSKLKRSYHRSDL